MNDGAKTCKYTGAVGAAIFSLLWVMCALPLYAEASTDGPVTVEITADTNQITLGEAIVLRYRITNASDQVVVLHAGVRDKSLDGPGADTIAMYRRDWLTMNMADMDGKSAPFLPEIGGASARDVQYGQNISLWSGNGNRSEGYIVASQWFVPSHAGHYLLTAHVRMPYAVFSESDVTPEQVESGLRSVKTVFMHDYVLPITIKPTNPQRLQTVAEALRKSATVETDVLKQSMLIRSLFSMPENYVWQSWQTIANDPTLFVNGRDVVVSEMSRIASLRAADILARMLTSPAKGSGTELQARVRRSLITMYQAGSPQLKEHIKKLLSKYRVTSSG